MESWAERMEKDEWEEWAAKQDWLEGEKDEWKGWAANQDWL